MRVYTSWYTWVGAALLALGIVLRAVSYPVISSDQQYFVAKWFTALMGGGLSAFANPFADYAPLYLYLIKLLTFIPMTSLYSTKTLSLLFDIVMTVYACLLLQKITRNTKPAEWYVWVYAALVSVPTVLINSSLWGQSDALYTAGIVACLYYLLAGRPVRATTAFGLALSVKLQAIFFLPVLVGYMLRRLRRAWLLVLVPIIFVATIVPAMLGGGHFSYWGLIYAHQSAEYSALNLSAPNMYAFILSAPNEHTAAAAGVAMALAVAALVVWALASVEVISAPTLLLYALASCIWVPFFLPHMHERYFYAADVLATIYALYSPRKWFIPVLVVGASFFSYMHYLGQYVPLFAQLQTDMRVPATIMLVAGMVVAYMLYHRRFEVV
jgi:Gpi18-like mannosyltransferase